MEQQPEQIALCTLKVVLMPNGEVIYNGKTIGWFRELKKDLTIIK